MLEKGYAETRRGPSHQVAPQVTCQSCGSVTWPLLVSFLCLAGPCLMGAALPGWLAAGWGWPWLAGAGPSWQLDAIARCDPAWGLAGLGWRTPTHTAHTHKTHPPPHLNEVNLDVCS